MQQAITCVNEDSGHWRIYEALGGDELTSENWRTAVTRSHKMYNIYIPYYQFKYVHTTKRFIYEVGRRGC